MAENELKDRSALVRRTFALITARLEDGAGRAAEGQGRLASRIDTHELAADLAALGEEVTLLCRLVELVAEPLADIWKERPSPP